MNDEPTEQQSRVNGRFTLIERIAAGATAEVWRARDEQLDRPVAVKLLHPHLLPDERSRRRFEAEARSVATLAHPGIVAVYDVDVAGDRPALVLELVEGESLAARLERDGQLSERDAAGMGAELGDALLHAHQRGVIHRDVKPGNILLGSDGRPRLVDFGIARSLAESADRLTLTGTVVGTPRYMAPEQLAGEPVGPRTDVYALGVVLYEALAGTPPFRTTSPLALADEQRSGAPPLADVDPQLASIVVVALAVDPAQRPRTAGAMADALRDWLAGRPVASFAGGAASETETMVAPAAAAAPLAGGALGSAAGGAAGSGGSGDTAAARDTGSRSLFIGSALGLAAVAAVILLALSLGQPRTEPPPVAAEPTETPEPAPEPDPTPAPEPPPGEAAANPGNRGQSGNLPRPVARLVEDYYEECGEDAPPPPDLSGMNKKQAEDVMDPLIEACEEADEDDDDD